MSYVRCFCSLPLTASAVLCPKCMNLLPEPTREAVVTLSTTNLTLARKKASECLGLRRTSLKDLKGGRHASKH